MAIDSLRDGFIRLCFDPSKNILGEVCRVVLEGQYYDPGSSTIVPDVLTKVTSTKDIDSQFGAGSVLAESLKTAINCCGDRRIEIFALPRQDAPTGVAAVYTLTVTGPATSDGRIDIYWGDGRWNISVPVSTGDTATAIAAAIAAAVPPDFPYTAVAALGVVTLTARNAGTVGNFLNPNVNWHGLNNYFPTGVTITTTQTVVGANDPAPLNYNTVFGDCCVCCFAMLYGNVAWQNGAINYLEDAWSCDKPQCFGHGYTYNAGSLGQILAQDTNSAVVSRMAHCLTDPNFPWLKVAAYAAKSCCLTVDNPELSIQGPQFGVLDCLSFPETCSSCFTFDEMQQLVEAGFVPTVPVSGGQGSLTSPQIVADITNNRYDAEGRENLTFQSVASRRLATVTATELAKHLQQFNGLGYYSDATNIREGARGTNRRAILGSTRAWAKSQVGTLFSEFEDINKDIEVTDDFAVSPRCNGVPGKLYLNMIYRPPVRIRQIVVNATPQLLTNC
jgi:phage tail sheath gpL-like